MNNPYIKHFKDREEEDETCEFCYYQSFDHRAYPCSRCVCNRPTENMFKPKIGSVQTDCGWAKGEEG